MHLKHGRLLLVYQHLKIFQTCLLATFIPVFICTFYFFDPVGTDVTIICTPIPQSVFLSQHNQKAHLLITSDHTHLLSYVSKVIDMKMIFFTHGWQSLEQQVCVCVSNTIYFLSLFLTTINKTAHILDKHTMKSTFYEVTTFIPPLSLSHAQPPSSFLPQYNQPSFLTIIPIYSLCSTMSSTFTYHVTHSSSLSLSPASPLSLARHLAVSL